MAGLEHGVNGAPSRLHWYVAPVSLEKENEGEAFELGSLGVEPNETLGAEVSTENVTGLLRPVCPAASACDTRAVYVPSESGVASCAA